MRIETNTPDRRLTANAVAEWLHEPVHYDGMPTCAYSIGPVTVERDGAISTERADAWAALMPFFESNGWLEQAQNQMQEHLESLPADSERAPETEPDSKAEPEDEPHAGITATCISIPMGTATPENIVNLLRTLYARQKLINAMTQSGRLFIDEEVVTLLHDAETDTREKIRQLISSEAAVNMVRGFSLEDGRISIEFPFSREDPARWQIYANLFFAIVRRAFEAHHVSAVLIDPADTEMKYFCNSWLMQMGYGGPENREARHILMDHLHGFAAFRTADRMNAHKARLTERRHAARQNTEVNSDDTDR